MVLAESQWVLSEPLINVSNNLIIIIIILLVIGIVVYFYYNYNNNNNDNDMMENYHVQPTGLSSDKKCVRFNNVIKCNIYNDDNYNSSERSSHKASGNSCAIKTPKKSNRTDKMRKLSKMDKINVDDILSEYSEPQDPGTLPGQNKCNPKIDIDLEDDDDRRVIKHNPNIVPSNLEQINPEDTWDASFGLPLMSKTEKKDFFDRMQKNWKKYESAISDFSKYQTDRSTVIETETTIDPFKPDHRSNQLKGRAIKDVYDEQVAGYKAKPKAIKKKTASQVIYDNESELNGGNIPGTDLFGFDGVNDAYKTAAFGNEF